MKDTLRLGYVGVTGDADAWRSFAVNIYGMQPVEAGETLRLRVDERAWRFAVEQGDEPGLAYVGIELESSAALDAAMQRIKVAGFEVTEDKALAVKRGVDRLARTRAVDGTPLELFAGALVEGIRAPQGISRRTDCADAHSMLLTDR